MTAPAEQPARDEFKDAASKAAVGTQDGRYVIHCFAGGFIGADWDLDGVLECIDSAQSVEFGPDLLRHHLRVIDSEGRLRRFDVPMPRRGRGGA